MYRMTITINDNEYRVQDANLNRCCSRASRIIYELQFGLDGVNLDDMQKFTEVVEDFDNNLVKFNDGQIFCETI